MNGENRVAQSGGAWNFSEIRSANYFINRVRPLLEAGELGGNEANNKHYLGEAYFFRAFYYANKLDSLGDFPIIKTTIADNYEAVNRPASAVRAMKWLASSSRILTRHTTSCRTLLQPAIA